MNRSRCFLLILSLFTYSSAYGASLVWNAAVSANRNTTTANWSGNVWNNGTPDRAVFAATGVGTVTLTTAITANQLTFSTAGYTIVGNTLTLGDTSPMITTDANATISSVLAGSSGLAKAGGGTLVVTGANSYSGGTSITSGTVQIGNGAANGSNGGGTYAIASGAKLYLNYLTAAAPTWAKFSGAGTLELNSAQAVNGNANWNPATGISLGSRFTGALQLDKGRLHGVPSGLGGATAIAIGNGAQFLAYDGTTGGTAYTFNQNFSINGLGWGESGHNCGALRVAGMNATFPGSITLTGNAALYTHNSSPNSAINVSGVIDEGGGGYGHTINAYSKPVTLSGNNTYGGDTTVSVGTLKLGASNVIPDGAGKGNVNVAGVIDLKTFSETINGLSGAGSLATVAGGTPTLTVGGNDATSTFSGTIRNTTGALALVKTGSGTLTLNGTNTYTGPTTVDGGTLGGSGSLLSPATIMNGATLAPGAVSIGTLTINHTLTHAPGSNHVARINKNGSTLTADRVSGLTSVTFGGNLLVTASGEALAAGDSFTLFQAGAFAGGFATVSLPPLADGMTWDLPGLASSGVLAVSDSSPRPTEGVEIVGKHAIVMNAPVGGPTQYMATGPLLGNGNTALESRAWVDANRNLFCIELPNNGALPLAMKVTSIKGAVSQSPASVLDNTNQARLGGEQYGGGRWYFKEEMADMAVLDQTLAPPEIAALAQGGRRQVTAFDGATAYPLNVPSISTALTIAGWIKVTCPVSTEANYIVSKGEWNKAYSLGLANGRLRFAIGSTYLQCTELIPLNQWVHVAGVFDTTHMAVWVDGVMMRSAGVSADAGAAFLYDPDAPDVAGGKLGVATRIVGGDGSRDFTWDPGATVIAATAILSDLDSHGDASVMPIVLPFLFL